MFNATQGWGTKRSSDLLPVHLCHLEVRVGLNRKEDTCTTKLHWPRPGLLPTSDWVPEFPCSCKSPGASFSSDVPSAPAILGGGWCLIQTKLVLNSLWSWGRLRTLFLNISTSPPSLIPLPPGKTCVCRKSPLLCVPGIWWPGAGPFPFPSFPLWFL